MKGAADLKKQHGQGPDKKTAIKKLLICAGLPLALILAGTAVFLAFKINSLLLPVDVNAAEQISLVTIPQGASTHQIADILEEKGIIRSALVFRMYVRYNKQDASLMAGDYHFSPALELKDIVEKLRTGKVVIETRWFTIPEGYNVEQMSLYLEDEGLVSGDEFLALCNNPPATLKERFAFLKDVPQGVRYHLEGYLFPAKYEIRKDATAEEILAIMLQRLQRALTEEYHQRSAELDFTLHETLTLASIIEKEAVVPAERKRISSVFHNRMEAGMLLQADPTVLYALGEYKEVVTYADLEKDCPYNTYRYPGLPPGPISSIGERALEAALYPDETDFYFFVAKRDGSGEHYFARTYAEHLRYRAQSRENQMRLQ